MSTKHSRRGSSRAALPRRSTKGPLDTADPLSGSRSLSVSPAPPASFSPATFSERDVANDTGLSASQDLIRSEQTIPSVAEAKDLSFLLDASIYHPLSYIDTPPPYRRSFLSAPSPDTSFDQIFSEIAELLKSCQFLAAAHYVGAVLTSGLVRPTDHVVIFRLLSVRYSSLELSGNVSLAAQESKALEDLSSSFYYDEVLQPQSTVALTEDQPLSPKHIMPFNLRLQALRLQGIGFGDSRRAVGALFDLGMECRDNLARLNQDERTIWEERLEEVGIRVVNALIDIGDIDCARRTLQSMSLDKDNLNTSWIGRNVLLLIKTGDVDKARQLLEESKVALANHVILEAFLSIADGNYDAATSLLSQPTTDTADPAAVALVKQNLAVAYLYTGQIDKSRHILEGLVNDGYSYQTLTVNLATLYDLISDKSRTLKTDLATKIAATSSMQTQREFVNADFKL